MVNPDTPEWPGDTPFTCGWASLISAGASVNVSSFSSSPHVGTHADAPIHVREGWSGSHELSLDAFFGPAIVVDVSSLSKEINMEDLEKIQSLPRESKNLPVHHMLFSDNAAILENLDLRRVTPTMYELMAFPLKLMALDAAPVRAVLRQIVA